MCISKVLIGLCAIKQKIKKNSRCCLQCFGSDRVLIEHKENCLIIKGKESVKLKSGSISSKNYFKELRVPFDFECIL